MKIPYMKRDDRKRVMISGFGGLNLSHSIKDNELVKTENLSSDEYPYLSPRGPRDAVGTYINPSTVYAWNGLIVIDDGNLIYDGEVAGNVSQGEKQFAVVSNKLCIFPDKMTLDLENKEFKNMEASVSSGANGAVFGTDSITIPGKVEAVPGAFVSRYHPMEEAYPSYIRICDSATWNEEDGWVKVNEREIQLHELSDGDIHIPRKTEYGNYVLNAKTYSEESYPEETDDGVYMYIFGVEAKQETNGVYTVTHYRELVSRPLTGIFKVGDVVNISGCTTYTANNKEDLTVLSVEENKLTFEANTFSSGNEAGDVIITRTVPDLEYICEKDNRLWGVKDQTIYASALGEPSKFYEFAGLSTDSYSVAVASRGDFTGCIGYGESILFFKEDMVYRLLGSYPAEYTIYPENVAGVKAGCHKSLVIINDILYYLGRDGVYMYNGYPKLISYNLGMKEYTEAAAGSDGYKYYISMFSGEWGVYVYDTLRGIWLREDGRHIKSFANDNGTLFFLDGNTLFATGAGTETVSWSAELCEATENTFNKKTYLKLILRADITGYMDVETSEDNGPFKRQGTLSGPDNTYMIPLSENRCNKLRIRLRGKGKCIVKGLTREFIIRSEM